MATATSHLSDDLITDILTRLPVKPLMKFKCVSKAWHAIISDPKFAKTQLRRANEGNSTSHQRIIKTSSRMTSRLQTIDYEASDDEGREDIDPAIMVSHVPGNNLDQWFTFVGHCDGLMCLSCTDGGYMLYNPTTRQSRNIPNSGLDINYLSYTFHGFGYDSSVDDYKILQGLIIHREDGSKEAEMKIFGLKSNSWRRIENSGVTDPYDMGIYLEGSLHWLVHRDGISSIVTFDLVEEEFKEVLPMPTEDPSEFLPEGLGISGNRLFLCKGTYYDNMEARIMNEYGKKELWIEWFNVPTDGIPGAKYYSVPLSRTNKGKIVINVDGRQLVLLNPEDGTSKEYPTEDADWESAVYVESLISPYYN